MGIESIITVDENFENPRQLAEPEQACQCEINDLELGAQRLHRAPGVGSIPDNGAAGRKILFAAFHFLTSFKMIPMSALSLVMLLKNDHLKKNGSFKKHTNKT